MDAEDVGSRVSGNRRLMLGAALTALVLLGYASTGGGDHLSDPQLQQQQQPPRPSPSFSTVVGETRPPGASPMAGGTPMPGVPPDAAADPHRVTSAPTHADQLTPAATRPSSSASEDAFRAPVARATTASAKCPQVDKASVALADAPACALDIFEAASRKLQRGRGRRSATTTTDADDDDAATGGSGSTSASLSGLSISTNPLAKELGAVVPDLDGAVYMVHYLGDGIAEQAKRTKAMAQALHRREAMSRVFSNHSVPIDVWLTELDREDIDEKSSRCLHSGWEPATYLNSAKRKRHSTTRLTPLKPTQVSVNSKHHLAMFDMLRRGLPMALIVEDDVLFHACFNEHLKGVLDSLKQKAAKDGGASAPSTCAVERSSGEPVGPSTPPSLGFDVLMIGGCIRMHAYRRKKKFASPMITPHLYLKTEARCAHAYLLSNRGAAALLNSMPLTLPIDFQITTAMRERDLRSIWVEPWLAIQGDFGECVTNELGATCIAKEKYTRAFDETFATDKAQCASFVNVPKPGSVP